MKILAAISRFPYPTDKGDKLRAFHLLRHLGQRHELHLVCLHTEAVRPDDHRVVAAFCKSLTLIPHGRLRAGWNLLRSLLNRDPFQVNYFRSPAMEKALRDLMQRHKPDAGFVQLIRLGQNIPQEGDMPWFLDYMDAFSIGMQNRVALSGGISKAFVQMEARRLKRYEPQIAAQFEGFSIISQQDAAVFPPLVREQMHILPNGVDDAFFEPVAPVPGQSWDLIFTGNMGYHPNVQAARYLVERIVPALERLGLQPTVCLAGTNPAPDVRKLAGPRVTVTGFVPDLRPYLAASRIAIAPLISGQGLQNKLLEAMAAGLPTVTTPLSAEALGPQASACVRVCDTPERFAEAIARLLREPEAAAALGREGQACVRTQFDWEAQALRLESWLAGMLG